MTTKIAPIVVALVGNSGSGKTYASLQLGKKEGYNTIVSFTTRPMREGETNGVEHWFVSPEDVPDKSEMCAYTNFGGYEYWTTWSQFSACDCVHVYVIDEKGLVDLMSKESSPFRFHFITVKITRENLTGTDAERIARDNNRMYLSEDFYDIVLHNDSTLEEFDKKIERLHQLLLRPTNKHQII